jgi:ABC-type branched-subunit amino acid transport system substrate-binding protein
VVLAGCSRASPPEGSEAAPSAIEAEAGSAERGRSLFLRGMSASGRAIDAEMGPRGGAVVDAASLPCAGCHGRDGRGRAEGGITPSNVRWESLTRPYVVTEASGRAHPPYTERLVGRAVAMGIDPAGQRLDPAMPRYRLGRQDLADLIAYLRVLSGERDPGVNDATIRVGTLVPASGPLAASGRAAREALRAFFADINGHGGIYGRAVELISAEIPGGPAEDRAAATRRFLDEAQPFALTGVLLDGDASAVAVAIEDRGVPLIGAVALPAGPRSPSPHNVFRLYAGLAEQAEVLASFAAERQGAGRTVVLRQADPDQREAARRIASRLGDVDDVELDDGAPPPRVLEGADRVFLLGPQALDRAVLDDLGRSHGHALVLVPDLGGAELLGAPRSLGGRVFAAFATLPRDCTPEAIAEVRRLVAAHPLEKEISTAQISAIAAGKLLVEGLQRAGRDANREALIEAIEGLRDFRTGLLPPLTFGKNRRIGALGAYVTAIDPDAHRVVPAGGWAALDERRRAAPETDLGTP